MGFKDDLKTDLTNTFFNKTEFAEDEGTVIITHAAGGSYEIAAIYDNQYESVDPNTGVPMMSTNPVIRINENELQQDIAKGDTVLVRGTNYKMYEPQPDGVGTILVELHKVML